MQRRAFLRGAAAAPLAAPLAGDVALKQLTGLEIGTGPTGPIDAGVKTEAANGTKIRDWFQYWRKREKEIIEGSRYVRCLDPDIATMHSLPLNSKFALQRRRNIEAEKRDMKRWFEKQIGLYGFVEFFE